MKNKIYYYFFKEFFAFFAIILFTLTAIVWTVQAVNYLDFVTEDGHAFYTYFSYSILGIPKIISKLMPFSFLGSIMLTILKLEENNELLVLWTSGLNKMKIVNIIFLISIFVTIIQLITSSTFSPKSLNVSRSLLTGSNMNIIPALLQEKKFNDTVKSLTIFVNEKKKNGAIENIFLREEGLNKESSTTFAKKGFLKKINKSSILVLFDGVIQKEKEGKISFIYFDKFELNLSKYKNKSSSWPKIQENPTTILFDCFFSYKNFELSYFSNIENLFKKLLNVKNIEKCPYPTIEVSNELNRRFGMPLYIPLLALIGCYLLSSRRESKNQKLIKFMYFLIGFSVLIFAEIAVRYSGKVNYIAISYYLLPILLIVLNYLNLFRVFKYENLTK
ncbi:MAG: hypothetical protein CBC24_01340 [Candidatus Pelagibacter sp. TMED64]|nr:hypothetical protein [Candidatus Pelagibacter sp.]OUU67326.1 MAG: hypothetical protein CBC24_01340 [Candidatus Pelagibacter sp. TMED64]|tara:strand:- start:5107 stop:6273 length:1167 start_codon:yes stop_codon:yes gene_type:complete